MAPTDESGEATDRPGTRKTNDRTRTAPELEERVDHPKHYQHASGVEAIVICEHMNFNLGNAVKYILRAGQKTPDPTEDLRKAAWYLARELDRLATGNEKLAGAILSEMDRRAGDAIGRVIEGLDPSLRPKDKPFQACGKICGRVAGVIRCRRPVGHDGWHEASDLSWADP